MLQVMEAARGAAVLVDLDFVRGPQVLVCEHSKHSSEVHSFAQTCLNLCFHAQTKPQSLDARASCELCGAGEISACSHAVNSSTSAGCRAFVEHLHIFRVLAAALTCRGRVGASRARRETVR
jgi:hypothetical protein